jgi:hypothetical protein
VGATVTRSWERFSEPWSTTLLRTVGLAGAIGIGVGLYQRRLVVVPTAALLALWFTLGGHFVEVWFRNGLRPRLSSPLMALVARLATWFVGGYVLLRGALWTRSLIAGHGTAPWPWWAGGVFFIGAELAVHLGLRARRQPNVFDGRG